VNNISWTDQVAIDTIKKISKEFNINTFVETGTFKGINAFVQSGNFKYILTCEKNPEYARIAKEKLRKKKNVMIMLNKSPDFLKEFVERHNEQKCKDFVFIYLDAHFYDKDEMNKFVVIEELQALAGFNKCVIAIHDFDNGMGHICYDGHHLNMGMVGWLLKKVNPNFKFYTNTPKFTNIQTIDSLKGMGLGRDTDAVDNIKYAWTSERLAKRGILYAVPKNLNLDKYKLVRI
jgi:hypothetical protein